MSLGTTPYLLANEAQEYFATQLDTEAWDDASDPDKLTALTQATLKIDQGIYLGTADGEEHAFPRSGEDEVHNDVKRACCELALGYLDGEDLDDSYSDQKVTSEGYSSVRASFDKDFVEFHKLLGLTRKAYNYLLPWLDLGNNPIKLTRIS